MLRTEDLSAAILGGGSGSLAGVSLLNTLSADIDRVLLLPRCEKLKK